MHIIPLTEDDITMLAAATCTVLEQAIAKGDETLSTKLTMTLAKLVGPQTAEDAINLIMLSHVTGKPLGAILRVDMAQRAKPEPENRP